MVAASCTSAAVSHTVLRTTTVAKASVSNRAAFFTGRKLPAAAPVTAAPRAAKMQQSVRALFGGGATANKSIYDFTVKSIDGKDIKMDRFKGKVLLIINVASACGFTPQYADMVELTNKLGSKGLEVLAFPCNQFGAQEPGSNSEIKSFAERKGFKGPMFAKIDVNGSGADPLFTFLKNQQGGMLTSDIKWNFSKFLVDREGNVVKRYGSTTAPLAIEKDIMALL